MRARILEACRDAGVSLSDVARAAGMPPSAIGKVCDGRVVPLVTTALRIASTLDREVEDLFEVPRVP